jgi:serine/threonine protein kinase/Flp pilus assembly protein TadD
MTPARLERIEEIFRAALDQKPDQISGFLDTTCKGDEILRRKIEALLSSRERATGFIETSAVGLATRVIQNQQADSLVGETIDHYRISELIGTGGMGDVYMATDIKAGRKAALKLLPFRFTGDAERLKRFEQEAHAVVALNHPNILTVYEIGEDHSIHYIASELIEGETLRDRLACGPMQLSEAVDIAIQIASALAAAHQAGIVHRDIKPENIMLRPDGYVKVLDFGIAKLAESAFAEATADGTESMTLAATNLGSILGTVRYMSPEQTCGAQVDKSTDVWSLGVVLYEMVTGHAPFTGDTPQDIMSSILEKEPSPLSRYIGQAPAELQRIVSRTLRKHRAQRYRNAHELLHALKDLRRKLEAELERAAAPLLLRWARSPAALVLILLLAALALALPFYRHRNPTTNPPPEKSIAVLPFLDLSQAKDQAYFCDGIQEEIMTRLANIADLKVISHTSTQRYQSKPRNIGEIAKELGVANILEGSVQKAAEQVRVNVQLINAQSDAHLWAESYDRKLTDIFGVESEIAKRIAESLQAKLTGREEQALGIKPTNNPEAYDAYLRGLTFQARGLYSALPGASSQAADFYERAVQLDPKFAIAWARLSRVDSQISYYHVDASSTARPDAAKRALENAQKLEPNSPETLLAVGYYQYLVLNDYALAKTTFGRVSKTLRGSSEVPMALGYIARREGHWDESVACFEQALTVDPRNVELLMGAAWNYAMLRQFPAALRLYTRALDITPNDPDVMASKASIYQAQGNLPEAAKFLSEINEDTPNENTLNTKINQLRLERNYGEAVRLLQARLAQFHFDSHFWKSFDQLALALMQCLAGDTVGAKVNAEQARNALEQLYREQTDEITRIGVTLFQLCRAYALMGERDSAVKAAERVIMLFPRRAKNPMDEPMLEENLAFIQTIVGEKRRAISTLTQLLQTPYNSELYGPGVVTPALLKLDPIWDPLRGDLRFEKLLEESKNPSMLK